jgi:hypothetical protein
MLEKLLQLIGTGGIHSYAVVARELGVTESLLDSMIAELVRLGYLRPAEAACEGHCQGCPERGACGIGGAGRAWVLTERGSRMAKVERAGG